LDLKLLQKQVADCTGVDKITIANWEQKAAIPAIRYMPAIIQFVGYNTYPRPAF
jgi:transcriptional regulator with XRE-family HTH domain